MMPLLTRLIRNAQINNIAATACRHNILTYPNYSTNIGNSALRTADKNEARPLRWKKVWALSMKRKAEIEGVEPPKPRSARPCWNYKAELSAFQHRLHIKCSDQLLSAAFTEPLPVSDDLKVKMDYTELATHGKVFTDEFITHYVNVALPLVPPPGQQAVKQFILKVSNIAYLASNLGYQDLLQCVEFPPSNDVLSNSFLASVEVINRCEGPVAAGRFLLDFVVPMLVGKDILHDIWKPNDPMSLLVEEMKNRSQEPPEARLVRQSGINTVTPVFYVALFSGKKFLSESGGESIPLAEIDAAKLALKHLYKIAVNSKVIPMGQSIGEDFLSKLFEPLLGNYSENINAISDVKASIKA